MIHGDIAVNRVAVAHKIRDLRGKAAFVADKLRMRVGVYITAAEHDGDYIKAAAVFRSGYFCGMPLACRLFYAPPFFFMASKSASV